MKSIIVLFPIAFTLSYAQYALKYSYNATNSFFDHFRFATESWSQLGFSNFVNRSEASSLGLIKYTNNKVYIGSDYTNVVPANSTLGRKSVRLESNAKFNSGLFILCLDHMPVGKGTWPAFWTFGPSWPNSGEVDIIEGIWTMNRNAITLHTKEGCKMPETDQGTKFTGTWNLNKYNNDSATDCWINAPDQYGNQGCGINAEANTFNTGFNNAGGGCVAMEWVRNSYIKVWNWVKPNVPSDTSASTTNPNPANWGTPDAYFAIGTNCPASYFQNQALTLNVAYCGWASQGFASDSACKDYVRNNPSNYTGAYFSISHLNYYCKSTDANCTTTGF